MKKCVLTCVFFLAVACSLFAVTDYTIRSGYTLSNSIEYGFHPMQLTSAIDVMHPVRGKNVTHGFGLQTVLDFQDYLQFSESNMGYVFNYGWDRIQFNMLLGLTGASSCSHDAHGSEYYEDWIGIGLRVGGLFYFDDGATCGLSLDASSTVYMDLADPSRFDYRIGATVSGVFTLRGWSIDERKNYEGGMR